MLGLNDSLSCDLASWHLTCGLACQLACGLSSWLACGISSPLAQGLAWHLTCGLHLRLAHGLGALAVAHSHVAPPDISCVAYTCGSHVASVTHSHAASAKGSLHIGHVMAQQSTPLLADCRGIDWGGQHHHTHMQLITSLYDQSLSDQGGRFMYHHTHMQRMALTHNTHAALRPHDPGLAVILFFSIAALPLGSSNASCSTHNQLAQSLGGCCGTDLGGAGL